MESSKEFAEGTNGIGYVGDNFKAKCHGQSFDAITGTPKMTTLPRAMTDAEIESELKPGFCTLGHVLAVIKSNDPVFKDGNWNLFYFPSFVVSVRWYGGGWDVSAWDRDDDRWRRGDRVFSPAIDHASNTGALSSDSSTPMTLESAEGHLSCLRDAMYKVVEKNSEGLPVHQVIAALKKISEDMYEANVDEALATIPVDGLPAIANSWDLTWLTLWAVELREQQLKLNT